MLVDLFVNIAYNVSQVVVSISQRMKFNKRSDLVACPFKAPENWLLVSAAVITFLFYFWNYDIFHIVLEGSGCLGK